ncbi:BA14K family protein [Lichenihabitans psoromatis]
MIGGAVANSQARYAGGDVTAYCERRFKSYDRSSGTYLGYDGNRHSCP